VLTMAQTSSESALPIAVEGLTFTDTSETTQPVNVDLNH
jgi:hypothetical protein